MNNKVETRNPILKTISIVEDRINEIMEGRINEIKEMGQIESSVTFNGRLMFYERLAKNLYKLYTGDI